MNLYNKLNNDVRTVIDNYLYLKKVKPIQDLLLIELNLHFIPKCKVCSKPLIYVNYYGVDEYYIRSHELCLECFNNSQDFVLSDGHETDDTYFDYNSDSTDISINTI